MTWERRETKVAQHYEFLKDKKGNFVGHIIRFNEKEKTYASTINTRLGAYATIGEAKDAVEAVPWVKKAIT